MTKHLQASQKGRCALFVTGGREEIEALTVVDLLRRAHIEVVMVSATEDLENHGAHGIVFLADLKWSAFDPEENWQALILPGGWDACYALREHSSLLAALKKHAERQGFIASICAAPIVLEAAGLLHGRQGTSYPNLPIELHYAQYEERMVVRDENLLTARGPAISMPFALSLIACLEGQPKAHSIASDLLFPELAQALSEGWQIVS